MLQYVSILTALLQLLILGSLYCAFRADRKMVRAILDWQVLMNRRVTDLERLVGLLLHQAEQRASYQKFPPTSH